MKRRPCPASVIGKKTGKVYYCQFFLEEDGSDHRGTCCGDRSPVEYEMLLKEAVNDERANADRDSC
jgi:hypothetical protein